VSEVVNKEAFLLVMGGVKSKGKEEGYAR